MFTRKRAGSRGYEKRSWINRVLVSLAVCAMTVVTGATTSNASEPSGSSPSPTSSTPSAVSAAPSTQGRNEEATPSEVKPLDATGCTWATPIIEICIHVVGTGNFVSTVGAKKYYSLGYIDACDYATVLFAGVPYQRSGEDCSPVGYYLEHTFNIGQYYPSGTQVCIRWDSYPNAKPCETIG